MRRLRISHCARCWLAIARCAAAAASVALLADSTARAQQPQEKQAEPSARETEMLRRLEALEEEVHRLRSEERSGAAEAPASSETAQPSWPNVHLTGVFQLDGAYFHQDAVNKATLGDIEDGLGFRRARLATAGEVAEDVSFMMEFDFAQAQGRFVDVWGQLADTPIGDLRIGRFRQPFGMSELTSVRDLPFLERPLTFALAPFRQTGVQLSDDALDGRLTWAIAGYRYLSDNYGNVFSDGGYGLSSRITGLLVDPGDDGILVHLGGSYSHNDPGRGVVQYASTNEVFVGQNPELGPSGLSVLPIVGVPPFVNTGQMPTDTTDVFGVEGAVSAGSVLVQAEGRLAHADLVGTTNRFPGAYAHARWVLTGETIPYNKRAGVFGRVHPRDPIGFGKGGLGAWELAARLSYIDLDGDGLPGPGRRLLESTVGLDWYLNDHVRALANWIHSDLDDRTLGRSQADTFAFRFQVDF